MLSSPDSVRDVFRGDPHVLHSGEGNEFLSVTVGSNSVIVLDDESHERQRRVLLPPLKGQRMRSFFDAMQKATLDAVRAWPLGQPIRMDEPMRQITLRVILTDSGLSITGTLTLNGQTLTANVAQGVGGAGLLLAGPVVGNGGLVKSGAGFVNLAGANAYTGATDIQAGFIIATGGAALGDSSEIVTVEAGATLLLQPSDPMFPIVEFPQHIIFAGASGNMAHLIIGPDSRLSGQITLAGPTEFALGGLEIVHGIDESGGSQNLTIGNNVPGFTSVGFDVGSVSTYTGTTTVTANGFAGFNGSGPPGVVVGTGATPPNGSSIGVINGSGTIGPLTIGPRSSLAPGDQGHGALTTGDFALAPPTTAGSGIVAFFFFAGGESTGLNVHGTVHLGGDLSTQVVFPLPPTSGTRWRLITNDGSDSVQSTFFNLPEGTVVNDANGLDLRITYHGGDGNDVELFAQPMQPAFAVGAGDGGFPLVNVYNANGGLIRSFLAYDSSFHGGVHVSTADMNRDGVNDIITAPGRGGGPVVRIWNGVTGAMIREFNAYDPSFRGGVNVAAADLDADTLPDIITGAGPGGGPHVKAFRGSDGSTLYSFMAFDLSFTGGVSVAGINGDPGGINVGTLGILITGAGAGGAPEVRAFSNDVPPVGAPPIMIANFLANEPHFTGGVNVAATGTYSLQNGGLAVQRIVTAPASAGGPNVSLFDFNGQPHDGFIAYSPNFQGGVTVAALPFGLNNYSVVTGPGPGGGSNAEVWSRTNMFFNLTDSLIAFDPVFTGGVFVG
jgi:autotransporter-associated beta strand protein